MTDSGSPQPTPCKRPVWFDGLQFEQLFESQATAAKALKRLGFLQRKRRFISRPASIGLVLALAFLASLLLPNIVPTKDDNRCFVVDGMTIRGPNASVQFGSVAGKLCPETKASGPFDAVTRWLSSDWPQVFQGLSVIVVIWIAILQLSKAREDELMTVSFTRKATTNGLIMQYEEEVGPLVSKALRDSETNRQDIFIYIEMDNLEFVFEKYRDHELSPKVTLRQCFIFVSRCANKEFAERAKDFAARGLYRKEFAEVVKNIVEFASTDFDSMLKHRIERYSSATPA